MTDGLTDGRAFAAVNVADDPRLTPVDKASYAARGACRRAETGLKDGRVLMMEDDYLATDAKEAIPAEFSDVRRTERPSRDRDLLGAVAALV